MKKLIFTVTAIIGTLSFVALIITLSFLNYEFNTLKISFFTLIYLIILGICFVLSVIISNKFSSLDLNTLENKYTELSPFVKQLQKRNRQVEKQKFDLIQKDNELSILTASMHEGFFLVDKYYELISYNKSALSILNADLNKEPEELLTRDINKPFLEAIKPALLGKSIRNKVELNGRIYSVLSNPIMRNGECTGALAIVFDITEREHQELVRKEFSSNVSHELKTPLTAIRGYSEIIKNGIAKPEDIPNFADKISDEANRLLSLIEDIIKISRLDENSMPADKTEFEVYPLCKKVIFSLEPIAHKKNISIYINKCEFSIIGYYSIIEETVFNLIDNAIKYNKDGGCVTVNLEEDDLFKKITVSDTGIGIPSDSKDHIFERFYRVDKSRSKEIGGTGLGLSIVKHGAALHNAEISLVSTENVGTKITLSFKKDVH